MPNRNCRFVENDFYMIVCVYCSEVAGIAFSNYDFAPFQELLNPGSNYFKFEDSTPVQTPATIDATNI